MRHITLVVIMVIGFIVGMFLELPQATAAGPPCPVTYTVKRGDTLSTIAYQTGTSVWQLAQINRIWNVNFIYPGQLLCLPSSAAVPPSGETGASHSSFDLVVKHKFDPMADPDAGGWTLGRNRTAGKRLTYPLLSGDAIETYAETSEVRQTSANASPLLWLVRGSAADETTYKLVVIGDPTPLLDLQMEIAPTQNIADIIPAPDPDLLEAGLCPETKQPVGELSLSGKNEVELEGELVTTTDIFIPITINEIDYHETAQRAESCYGEVGFALHSMPNPEVNGYRLLMVMTDDGTIGPPGQRWRQQRFRWSGGGWWSRWRRSWYGGRR